MRSSRAPLCVFFAAFGTFLVAFGTLVALLRPDGAGAQKRETVPVVALPGQEGGVRASLAPLSAGGLRPAAKAVATGRVVDTRGAPIPGARIDLVDDAGATVASTECDAAGRFEAGVAADGALALVASAPGYQSAPPIRLSGNARRADLGDVALRDGGALRVRVSGDLRGALAGATVALLPAAGGAPLSTATTAADGTGVLRGVDRGAYRLRVEAAGHAHAERAWKFEGVGRDGTGEIAFVLLPLVGTITGEAQDANLRAIDEGEIVARMVRPEADPTREWRAALRSDGSFEIGPLPAGTFELELVAAGMVQQGHVYADVGGEPVSIVAHHGGELRGRFEGAVELTAATTLALWKVDPLGRAQPLESSPRFAVDVERQTFRFEGVAPGRYLVRAVAEGYAPSRSLPFEVATGSAAGEIVVELGEGGRFEGSLVDHRGDPIAQARVTLFEGAAPPPPAWASFFPRDARQQATTGPDGRFDLSGLASGAQVVVFEAPGQPPRSFGPLWIAEGTHTTLAGLSIAGGAVLSVSLHDGAGVVAAGGRVRVSCVERGIDVTALADEQGNLCLRGLPAGSYWLAPADGSEPREVALVAGETQRLELEHAAR